MGAPPAFGLTGGAPPGPVYGDFGLPRAARRGLG